MGETRRRVALLGATGSIGTQTLDVLRAERDGFELVAVAAGQRLEELAAIAEEFGVARVGVADEADRARLTTMLRHPCDVVTGPDGLADLARDADVVVNAVMGFAGLPVTLAALEAGRRLALANKESLIAAAPLVEKVRHTPGATMLPVDSEHCAIHQCLAGSPDRAGHPDVRRLLLTASGGPFRGWSSERLARVTKADALNHPTWSMGPKITVDSSTLMNKGLEVLEASALFGVDVGRVDVVVHPQSIVHSMVEFIDGSVVAQLSRPDMRLPIAYCLGLPERLALGWGALDFTSSIELTFEPPDYDAFPAPRLAYAAARRGGAAPAWLNAANEVAVEAFLAERIAWIEIVPLVAAVMDDYVDDPLSTLSDVVANDAAARRRAHDLLDT
ncbi:MAG: 1-deoxy-D-xylulose-5-phosphate reductoisomerase [Acidimicrobiales bacterium]